MDKLKILKEFSEEELRDALKQKIAERHERQRMVPRCVRCKHFNTIDKYGKPLYGADAIVKSGFYYCCPYHKTKNGTRYKAHALYQKACAHFERKD